LFYIFPDVVLKTGWATTVETLQYCVEWKDYFTCLAGCTF